MMNAYALSWNNHCLELGRRTLIMGVLNITPDSFSDGGHFFNTDIALAHGEKLVSDGADILDIGGESTRPFSEAISEEEECRRVLPVIEQLAKRISIPISIDTVKSGVARRALDAGAAIINDISALHFDPDMATVAAKTGVPLILMHKKGTPKTMQVDPVYDDLLGEIRAFFEEAIDHAVQNGISRQKIIIDPGIGFGKTLTHNMTLINHLDVFSDLNVPILIGTSRKAFIRRLLKKADEKDIDPMLPIVETGTQASIAISVLRGASVVRVHDVANTKVMLTVLDAIKQS